MTIRNDIVAVFTTVFTRISGMLFNFNSRYASPITNAITHAIAADSVGVNTPPSIPKMIVKGMSIAGKTLKNDFTIILKVAFSLLGN